MKLWSGAAIPALFLNKIYIPEMSAQNGKVVGPETVKKQDCFSENPEDHIKFIKKYIDAGFTHICPFKSLRPNNFHQSLRKRHITCIKRGVIAVLKNIKITDTCRISESG